MVYDPRSQLRLFWDDDALQDLQAIDQVDQDGHDELMVLMEEIQDDPHLRSELLSNFYENEDISVKRWVGLYRSVGVDLRRLKFWDLEDHFAGFQYRVIYYYHPPDRAIYVMAVVNKRIQGAFDYDDRDHPVRKRILAKLDESFGGGYGRRR